MPYYGPLPDTLLVDGTDIQSLTGIVIIDVAGLFAPGTRRGGDDVIPGRTGQVGAELPYDAYAFSVPIAVIPGAAGTRASMLANLRAAMAPLAGTNGLVTLERRLANVGGTYDAHTADGRFVAATNYSMIDASDLLVELQFLNLSGAWFDGTAWLVP